MNTVCSLHDVCNEVYDNIMGVVIGILGCISVLEKPGQNPDMHAPPGGTGTVARRLVSLACCVGFVWISRY